MKRIEKLGEYAVKAFTLPIRVCVGVYKCIEKIYRIRKKY